MKITKIYDEEREEEIVLYLQRDSELSRRIEALLACEAASDMLMGYGEGCVVRLAPQDIACVAVEQRYAVARMKDGQQYRLRCRLYEAESILGESFLRINQSCLINLTHVDHFDTTLGGTLIVVLKNGYRDYVSRRQLRAVKERLGL